MLRLVTVTECENADVDALWWDYHMARVAAWRSLAARTDLTPHADLQLIEAKSRATSQPWHAWAGDLCPLLDRFAGRLRLVCVPNRVKRDEPRSYALGQSMVAVQVNDFYLASGTNALIARIAKSEITRARLDGGRTSGNIDCLRGEFALAALDALDRFWPVTTVGIQAHWHRYLGATLHYTRANYCRRHPPLLPMYTHGHAADIDQLAWSRAKETDNDSFVPTRQPVPVGHGVVLGGDHAFTAVLALVQSVPRGRVVTLSRLAKCVGVQTNEVRDIVASLVGCVDVSRVVAKGVRPEGAQAERLRADGVDVSAIDRYQWRPFRVVSPRAHAR